MKYIEETKTLSRIKHKCYYYKVALFINILMLIVIKIKKKIIFINKINNLKNN